MARLATLANRRLHRVHIRTAIRTRRETAAPERRHNTALMNVKRAGSIGLQSKFRVISDATSDKRCNVRGGTPGGHRRRAKLRSNERCNDEVC
ncbi:hypothetical protein CW696_07690 [ANME-2 cluster archaeon]|nr:MAG: hypothetical protein CW696_07690 [ANME-2 cluster archaeon]